MGFSLAFSSIILEEGFTHKPIKDAGKFAVGFGHRTEDSQTWVSLEDAVLLLREDLLQAKEDVKSIFGNKDFKRLSGVRQAVLMNMAYNMGRAGLSSFKNMIAAVKAGDFGRGADEILDSRFASQLPNRSRRMAGAMRINSFLEE